MQHVRGFAGGCGEVGQQLCYCFFVKCVPFVINSTRFDEYHFGHVNIFDISLASYSMAFIMFSLLSCAGSV